MGWCSFFELDESLTTHTNLNIFQNFIGTCDSVNLFSSLILIEREEGLISELKKKPTITDSAQYYQ